MKEIELRKDFLEGNSIQTLYFGGGTPSILEPADLDKIFEALHKNFRLSPEEITLEANPDDISKEKIAVWKAAGVNRLSIGVQSFSRHSLEWMNRAHNEQQAVDSILLAKEGGITNLTIDLIYGTPGLSDEQWQKNILQAAALGVQHLSCYALTVEPKTALDVMIKKKKISDIDPEKQARQFLLLMDMAASAGFEHYEISNFAKPGFQSRHNSAYWKQNPYLGLGPSAHSYKHPNRLWNISNNALYIKALNEGNLPLESEKLTVNEQYNEYIMTSLRTAEGIHSNYILQNFGESYLKNIQQRSTKYLASNKLLYNNNVYTLSREGKLFADGIAMDLFIV